MAVYRIGTGQRLKSVCNVGSNPTTATMPLYPNSAEGLVREARCCWFESN